MFQTLGNTVSQSHRIILGTMLEGKERWLRTWSRSLDLRPISDFTVLFPLFPLFSAHNRSFPSIFVEIYFGNFFAGVCGDNTGRCASELISEHASGCISRRL